MIGNIDTPFEDCDTDSQSVDSTGASVAAIFTNLTITKQRGIMLQNRAGGANLLIGKSLATARWRVLPGAIFVAYPRDLAKMFIKSDGAALTVDIFQAI